MANTRCMLDKQGYTHAFARVSMRARTHRDKYSIVIAFPRQQWLHEHTSVLRYTYIACLVEHHYEGEELYDSVASHRHLCNRRVRKFLLETENVKYMTVRICALLYHFHSKPRTLHRLQLHTPRILH